MRTRFDRVLVGRKKTKYSKAIAKLDRITEEIGQYSFAFVCVWSSLVHSVALNFGYRAEYLTPINVKDCVTTRTRNCFQHNWIAIFIRTEI